MLPPAFAVTAVQVGLYDPGNGLFNQILDGLPLPASQSWLRLARVPRPSALVIASTWLNLGTGTLIYLAALQNIPGELYESAELDGAGFSAASGT